MLSTALKTESEYSRSELHSYQHTMMEHIKARHKCALWVDMGLGKTISTLTAVGDMYDALQVNKILIVAPLLVAQETWPREFLLWEQTTHLPFTVLDKNPEYQVSKKKRSVDDKGMIEHYLAYGPKYLGDQGSWERIHLRTYADPDTPKKQRHNIRILKKLELLKNTRKAQAISKLPTNIHIISRDNVAWLSQGYGDKWPYDMVVIDESSSFKSAKAKRFRALKARTNQIDRLVELTGTPTSKSLLDLWSQIYLIDQGERLGKTITAYREKYFIKSYDGFTWDLRAGAADEIYAKLQDICLTLKAEDYLNMPKRIDNYIKVTLPPQARKQYRDLERDFLVQLEGETITTVTAAALTNKLLQFANGALYADDKDGTFIPVHDLKLDALDNIIEEAMGAPLLVAYNFKSDLARIKKKYPYAVTISEPGAVERWNRGEIALLLAHPASAGHGLNLQHGGSTLVWFGLNWSLELYQQFNARLHRQGQKRPTIIHHIEVENSVDQTVLQSLSNKNITQKALLDALKKDIGKRL